MNRAIFLFCLILFFACKNEEQKSIIENNNKNSEMINFSTNNNIKIVSIIPFNQNEIDSNLYEGTIVEAKKWEDKNGINYYIISEKKTTLGTNGNLPLINTYEVHGYHYIEDKDKNKLILKTEMKDFKNDYQIDQNCAFADSSFIITDVDKNHIGEITFGYYFENETNNYSIIIVSLENFKSNSIKSNIDFNRAFSIDSCFIETSYNQNVLLKQTAKYILEKTIQILQN